MSSMSPEAVYQHALEQVLQGTHMRLGLYGISDITTDQCHAEIKEWQGWRGTISQLLLYNMASPRKELRVYFFGERPNSFTADVVNTIIGILKKFDIMCFCVLISEERELQITNLETSEVSNHAFEPKATNEPPILSVGEKAELDTTSSSSNDHIVDVGRVAYWLETKIENLMATLRDSYKRGVDYTVTKPTNVPKRHGGQNRLIVLITLDCFKMLCMRSRTKKAEDVRAYFTSTCCGRPTASTS